MNRSTGYDWNIFVKQNEVQDYSCPLCLKVLSKPVKTSNGCEFCHSCAQAFISLKMNYDRPVDCPKCFNEVFTKDQLEISESSIDIINSLECKCLNSCKNIPCLWKGTISTYKAHFQSCWMTELECDSRLVVQLGNKVSVCLSCSTQVNGDVEGSSLDSAAMNET